MWHNTELWQKIRNSDGTKTHHDRTTGDSNSIISGTCDIIGHSNGAKCWQNVHYNYSKENCDDSIKNSEDSYSTEIWNRQRRWLNRSQLWHNRTLWGNRKSHDSLGNNDSTIGHRKWTIELYNDNIRSGGATIGQGDDIILVSEFAVVHSHNTMSHSEDIEIWSQNRL